MDGWSVSSSDDGPRSQGWSVSSSADESMIELVESIVPKRGRGRPPKPEAPVDLPEPACASSPFQRLQALMRPVGSETEAALVKALAQ